MANRKSKRYSKVSKNDPKQKARNTSRSDGRDHENEQKDETKLSRRLKTPEYTTGRKKHLTAPFGETGKCSQISKLPGKQISVRVKKAINQGGKNDATSSR